MTLKPFLVFHLNLIPWRISAHHVKSLVGSEYLRELYAPMEETLLFGNASYFGLEVGRELTIVCWQWLAFLKMFHRLNLLQRTHHGLCVWHLSLQVEFLIGAALVFVQFIRFYGMIESIGIDVASTAQTVYSCRCHQFLPTQLLDDFLLQCFFWQMVDEANLIRQTNLCNRHLLNAKRILEAKSRLVARVSIHSFYCLLIHLLQCLQRVLILSGQRLVGHTVDKHLQVGNAQNRVAAAYVMVEERKRLACAIAFNPQHHLTQLHCVRIVVNGIHATRDNLAKRLTIIQGCRIVLASTERAYIPGNGASHRQDNMSGSACRITNLHIEQSLYLLFGGGAVCHLLLDDRLEGGLDKVLHQVRASVIRRSALTIQSTDETELPVGSCNTRLYKRTHFENALIHRAKLLYVERRIVYLHPLLAFVSELVESRECSQQITVANLALLQPMQGLRAKEHAAQRLYAQLLTKRVRLEEVEGVHQSLPQVGILALLQV